MRGWFYKTKYGVFRIVQSQDGRWLAMSNDEALGSYHRPEAALDDLVGGHTFTPSNGIETDEAGLPDELSAWTPIR